MEQKTKTTLTHSNSSMTITSKHFIDKLESSIIQIAKAFAIEYSLPVDPDAKAMTRDVVQRKINQLLLDKEREGVKEVWDETLKIIKNQGHNTKWDVEAYARKVYEALKTAGFDNV